jgi:CheY-like chemotaxis protein
MVALSSILNQERLQMRKVNKMKTILIVDDNENDRFMCEKSLRDAGYTTHSVSSGPEALRLVAKNPTLDLIILDVKMAPLDGIEVLKQLRARQVGIPVILYSDFSFYRENFDTWLADAYVVKSSELGELKRIFGYRDSSWGAVQPPLASNPAAAVSLGE